MPPHHLIPSYSCHARNAFNPSTALLAAFLQTPKHDFSHAAIRKSAHAKEPSLLEKQQLLAESLEIRKVSRQYDSLITRHVVDGEPWWSEETPNLPTQRQASPEAQKEPRSGFRVRVRKQVLDRNIPATISEKRNRARALHEQLKGAERSETELGTRLNPASESPTAQSIEYRSIFRFSSVAQDRGAEFVIDPSRSARRLDSWKGFQQDLGRSAHHISQMKVSSTDTATIESRKRILNYDGLYIQAPKSPLESSQPLPWRVEGKEKTAITGMELLNLEIDKFAKYMDCTPMETAARASVIRQVNDLIARSCRGGVRATTFGSQEVGLANVLSDVDIRLSFEHGAPDPQKLTNRMRLLEYALSKSPDFMLVSLRNAKYPIINAQHRHTNIDIQIVSAPETNAQRDAMAHYLQTLPQLRSVYVVLRTALGIRGLVDVFNGGIGSYGLFMMLAASLQRPLSNPPTTPAESLLRFLDFYSDLDMSKYGVSVSPPKLFKKHSVFTTSTKSHIDSARRRGDPVRAGQWAIGQTRIYQPYLFCLQDPADPLNDLGRKSNAIKHIQTTIQAFRNTLRKYLQDVFPQVPDSLRWKDGSILLPLVGRCHEIYHDRRSRAEEQGRIAVQAKADQESTRSISSMEPTVEEEQKAVG